MEDSFIEIQKKWHLVSAHMDRYAIRLTPEQALAAYKPPEPIPPPAPVVITTTSIPQNEPRPDIDKTPVLATVRYRRRKLGRRPKFGVKKPPSYKKHHPNAKELPTR